jgi:hypothetical protein
MLEYLHPAKQRDLIEKTNLATPTFGQLHRRYLTGTRKEIAVIDTHGKELFLKSKASYEVLKHTWKEIKEAHVYYQNRIKTGRTCVFIPGVKDGTVALALT